MSHPYAQHDRFIAPAWPRSELWRVLVLVVAFEAIFATAPYLFASLLPGEAAREAFFDGTTAVGTLMQFGVFGLSALGLAILLNVIHGRGFWSLVGPVAQARQDLVTVARAVAIWLAVMYVLPPWIDTAELAEVRNLGTWLVLLPIALLVLLIQVSTEELFFRGYLQQQIACFNASPWAWMVVPSAMFGLLHFWNGQGAFDGTLWAIWAAALGMACADLTARTGNLGPAIGLHLANNAFAVLLVGIEGRPGSGLALFVYPEQNLADDAQGFAALLDPIAFFVLAGMLLGVLIMWLAARIALRR